MTKKLILTISFIILSALILVSCSNKAKTPMPISESSTTSSVESQSENESTTNTEVQKSDEISNENLFLKKMSRSHLTRQKVIIRILQHHQKRTLVELKKEHLQRQMPSRYSQVLQQLSRQGKKLQPKKLPLPQSRQPQRNILLLKNLLM